MKKNILNLQNIIRLLAIILSSTYLTFLVDCYTLNTTLKRIFVFGYFLVMCSLCLFLKEKYWVKKHPSRRHVSSFLLAGLISIGLLLAFQDVFLPSVIPSQLTLTADGTGEVWLVEVEIDEKNIQLSDLEIDENLGWEYNSEYDDYVFYPDAECDKNELSFNISKNSIVLRFATNPWSGGIMISHGDENIEYIDLFSPKNDDGLIENLFLNENKYSVFEITILSIGAYLLILFFLQIIFHLIMNTFANVKLEWKTNEVLRAVKIKESKNYSIFIFIFIAIWRIIYMNSFNSYVIYPDSWSYINYPWYDFFHFNISSGRVPIYPFFLAALRFVFGESQYLLAVPFVQMIISITSLFFLYKTLLAVTCNKKISNLFTTLYGLNPDIIVWDSSILTESIALSLTIFFLYIIVSYIHRPSRRAGIYAVLLTLVMIFFRPTFLLFGVLLFGFWILRWFTNKNEREILTQLIAVSICAFLIVAGYSYNFMKTFGIFSISDAMPRQNTVTAISQGHYLASDDPEYISTITESLITNEGDIWGTCGDVLNKFGLSKANYLAKESFSKDKDKYIQNLISKMLNDSRYEFSTYYINFSSKFDRSTFQFNISTDQLILTQIVDLLLLFLTPLLQIKIGYMYIIILSEIIIFFCILFKHKKINWIHLGVLTFMSLIISSTYVATCGEYARTMIHILPFFYIGVANFISIITLEREVQLRGFADETL